MARAGVAFELGDRAETARAAGSPDCRACRHAWRARSPRRRICAKAAISRSRSAAVTPGMSPSMISAPAASGEIAAHAGLQRARQARCDSRRLCATPDVEPGQRRADALVLVAGDHDDRPLPGWPARARRCAAPAACRRTAPSACSARPCGSSGRRRARWHRRARRRAPRTHLARLRPRRDLHQQAADAHAGDVGVGDVDARRSAGRAPSRSRSPWGCARSPARRSPACRRSCRARSDCRDRPACRRA